MPGLTYPAAHIRSEANNIGGVAFDDPYQWLEESSKETLSWQESQDKLARDYIRAWPGWAKLRREVERREDRQREFVVPTYDDGLWFGVRVPEGKELAVVEIFDVPGGKVVETLLDLNQVSKGEPLQLGGFALSPDRKLLSYAVTEAGKEIPSIKIVDRTTGEAVLDGINVVRGMPPMWLPNSDTLFYFGVLPENAATLKPDVFRFHLGEDPPHSPEALDIDYPVFWPVISHDKRHLLIMVNHFQPRPYYRLDLSDPDGPFVPFLNHVAGKFKGDIVGDRYICVTDDNAPRGRVVSIPLDTATDRSTWEELIPSSDAVVTGVTASGDRVVVCEIVDAASRLRVMTADGTVEGEIPLPEEGLVSTTPSSGYQLLSVLDPVNTGEAGEIVFGFASFTQSPALYRCRPASREVELLTEPSDRLEGVTIRRLWAQSKDGTRVPADVVHRSDLDLSSPNPTLIHGYGGYNVSLLPSFLGPIAPFIESGGVYVYCHLRGGGEFGNEWWLSGRMENKQNVFDDLFGICQQLIAEGIASPGQMALHGASNGGLLAGAALTQRPDLFGAVVAQVPLLDCLRVIRDDVSMVAMITELGNPHNPEDTQFLSEYSPYHNIGEGIAYPPVLLDAGENDPRCPPWHARKMAARLQAATSSENPVLLRVWKAAGHGGTDRTTQIDQQTDWLAFVMQQLGVGQATD